MSETDNPVEAIFLDALEIPADKPSEFLKERCGADDSLRKKVEELLAAHAQTGSFFVDRGLVEQETADIALSDAIGKCIGPYTLRERIGEGGMGVVYVAEQERPIRRKVALKVIKPGMDSKAVLARFEAEQQALAIMDHSNITKVFDARTTESGRPYFAMELVRDVPIAIFESP